MINMESLIFVVTYKYQEEQKKKDKGFFDRFFDNEAQYFL